METVVHAYAKLNLVLDVLGKAEDGYHDMLTIMQGSSLCDDLRVRASRGGGCVTIRSGLPYVPSDGRNIAVKAARLFLSERDIKNWNVHINVKKRLPVCAGLGGGSSDAAAVLRAMNAMFREGLTAGELRDMASRLGSDVPYCVTFGTMRGEGRGDRLTRLPDMPDCGVVICKPRFSVSTPMLFKELDRRDIRAHPYTSAAEAALEAGDLAALGKNMANVFEGVLGERRPAIEAIKRELLRLGALGAVMSGTGSAVFGIYDSISAAKTAAEAFNGILGLSRACRTIKSLNL